MRIEEHAYYKIGEKITDMAHDIFCMCEAEKDFCIQNPSSLVFGSVNRIYWTTVGFKADSGCCTKQFLFNFHKIMKG